MAHLSSGTFCLPTSPQGQPVAVTWHHTFGLGHLLWSLNPSSFCELVRVITPFFLKSHHLWHLPPFLKSIFSQSTRNQTWILLKGSLFLDMLSTLKQNIMGCSEVTGNSFYTGVQTNGMLAIKIGFIDLEFCPPVSLIPFPKDLDMSKNEPFWTS